MYFLYNPLVSRVSRLVPNKVHGIVYFHRGGYGERDSISLSLPIDLNFLLSPFSCCINNFDMRHIRESTQENIPSPVLMKGNISLNVINEIK